MLTQFRNWLQDQIDQPQNISLDAFTRTRSPGAPAIDRARSGEPVVELPGEFRYLRHCTEAQYSRSA